MHVHSTLFFSFFFFSFLGRSRIVRLVADPAIDTLAPPGVQRAISERLAIFPTHIRESMHRARCYIPAKIAKVLRHDPQLVAAGVSVGWSWRLTANRLLFRGILCSFQKRIRRHCGCYHPVVVGQGIIDASGGGLFLYSPASGVLRARSARYEGNHP